MNYEHIKEQGTDCPCSDFSADGQVAGLRYLAFAVSPNSSKCQSRGKRTVDTTDSIVKLRNTRDQETPNAFDDGELLPTKYIRKLKAKMKRNKKKMAHNNLCTPFFDLQQGITAIAMTRRQFSSRAHLTCLQ